MATPVGAEHRDLEQRFRKIERGQSELVSATLRRQPIKADSLQVDVNSTTLPSGAFGRRDGGLVPIPEGYTRALVTMYCSAGVTFSVASGGNSVGVQPVCNNSGGPAVSTGTSGANALSVVSNGAFSLEDLTPGGTINLQVEVATVGTVVAGSGNYHISASVLFLR
jgi:hypothetical protein